MLKHRRSFCLSPWRLLLALSQVTFVQSQERPPNIVLIIVDDLRSDEFGAGGHPYLETPNIDRLVRKGVTFTHCFNQGAWHGAVCVASRAMLNTGRYLWQCGGDDCGDYPLWGQVMGSAGYDTYITGKWHNGKVTLGKSFKKIGPTGGGMFESKDPNKEENLKQGIVNDPYDRPREGIHGVLMIDH